MNVIVIIGIGVALVALFGIVSAFLRPTLPDFSGLIGGGGGELESAGGDTVDNTDQILDGVRSMMQDRDKKARRWSVITGFAFYLLGVGTTAYGDPVVKLLQAAAM